MHIAIRALLALAMLLAAGTAMAVEAIEPWVRATPPGSTLSAGFVVLQGDSDADDRLLSASSPRAGRVEIHENRMDGEIMRMRALPDGVAVPAGSRVELAPGGIHLMLLELSEPLQVGEQIALLLSFESGVELAVQAIVRAPGDSGPSHDHHH